MFNSKLVNSLLISTMLDLRGGPLPRQPRNPHKRRPLKERQERNRRRKQNRPI